MNLERKQMRARFRPPCTQFYKQKDDSTVKEQLLFEALIARSSKVTLSSGVEQLWSIFCRSTLQAKAGSSPAW